MGAPKPALLRLSCAGKVFITGEYSCIVGGPALLATIAPTFTLSVHKSSNGAPKRPFAAQSPAGLFLALEEHEELIDGLDFFWTDPYQTPIGVGSSSAQFVLSVAAVAKLAGAPPPSADFVLETYWRLIGDSQGIRPSGVDVVAQWLGGPLLVRNEPFATRMLPAWKEDAKLLLAFTGRKARTHEHLKTLSEIGFPASFSESFGKLDRITDQAIQAWEGGDPKALGKALSAYQRALNDAGLAPDDFTSEIDSVRVWPGVYGCKASGAQGGDCVLLLVDTTAMDAVCERLNGRGWTPIPMQWHSQGVEIGAPTSLSSGTS